MRPARERQYLQDEPLSNHGVLPARGGKVPPRLQVRHVMCCGVPRTSPPSLLLLFPFVLPAFYGDAQRRNHA